MNPQISTLKASLKEDQEEIERIYQQLEGYANQPNDPKDIIVMGYYLHNLYSAFENICLNVAKTFENQIEDLSQWHAALLKRMTLDIEGFRPHLLSREMYHCLDELRRFRHLFRNAYGIELDAERLAIVFNHAQRLRRLYPAELACFDAFLDSLV